MNIKQWNLDQAEILFPLFIFVCESFNFKFLLYLMF